MIKFLQKQILTLFIKKDLKKKLELTIDNNEINISFRGKKIFVIFDISTNSQIKNNKSLQIKIEERIKIILSKIKLFKTYIIYNEKINNNDSKAKKNNIKKEINNIKKNNHNNRFDDCKIIAINATKGGVGKTTISVNIALTLAKLGYKTAIIDADIYGPSVSLMLDVNKEKSIISDNNKIKSIKKYNLEIISIDNITNDKNKALVFRGPLLHKAINKLLNESEFDNKLDYLIIDLPPGTGDINLSIMQKLPLYGTILVSTASNLAIYDNLKSVDMLKKLNINIIGIIDNMSFIRDGNNKRYLYGNKDNVRNFAKENNIKFLGEIELIPNFTHIYNLDINKKENNNIAIDYGMIVESFL